MLSPNIVLKIRAPLCDFIIEMFLCDPILFVTFCTAVCLRFVLSPSLEELWPFFVPAALQVLVTGLKHYRLTPPNDGSQWRETAQGRQGHSSHRRIRVGWPGHPEGCHGNEDAGRGVHLCVIKGCRPEVSFGEKGYLIREYRSLAFLIGLKCIMWLACRLI